MAGLHTYATILHRNPLPVDTRKSNSFCYVTMLIRAYCIVKQLTMNKSFTRKWFKHKAYFF